MSDDSGEAQLSYESFLLGRYSDLTLNKAHLPNGRYQKDLVLPGVVCYAKGPPTPGSKLFLQGRKGRARPALLPALQFHRLQKGPSYV